MKAEIKQELYHSLASAIRHCNHSEVQELQATRTGNYPIPTIPSWLQFQDIRLNSPYKDRVHCCLNPLGCHLFEYLLDEVRLQTQNLTTVVLLEAILFSPLLKLAEPWASFASQPWSKLTDCMPSLRQTTQILCY